MTDGDGCSSTCTIEIGYSCTGGHISNPDTCSGIWGDGLKMGGEDWDDNNTNDNDGCSSLCVIEIGYTCTSGSVFMSDTCNEVWGDGLKFATISTFWDDGNTIAGDGWDESCMEETGYICTGGTASSPDTCSEICGDGLKIGSEAWDDSNTNDNDGWDSTCIIETDSDWIGGDPSNPDNCDIICGNGIMLSTLDHTQHWDDGNIIGGDGWDGNCHVEDNWVMRLL